MIQLQSPPVYIMSSPTTPPEKSEADGQYAHRRFNSSEDPAVKTPLVQTFYKDATNLRTIGVLFGTFVVAVVFAVGHHLYLASINGHAVHGRYRNYTKKRF